MADAIYAVVDKSKKKNRTPPKKDVANLPEGDTVKNEEYPMASLDSMYSTLSHSIPSTATPQVNAGTEQQQHDTSSSKFTRNITKKEQFQNRGTSCKVLACLFITIAVVAIVLLICIAVLFAEVANLKQTATPRQISEEQQTPSIHYNDSSILLQLQLLNNTISEIRNNVHTTLPSSIGSLNVSFHEQLDTRLNTSIELLYEQVSATLDDHTERIDGLDQLLETVNSSAIDSDMMLMELSRDFQFVAGQFMSLLLTSCAALPPSSPSGYYWARASNGSAVRVYCDMTLSCGTITGGWMRVADITDGCPNGLEPHESICRINTTSAACSPAIVFNTVLEYSSVCGKVTAVLKGSPDGFADYGDMRMGTITPLDGNYVDGVSITHGHFMHHIWTFAAYRIYNSVSPPSYVHGNYFCDIGQNERVIWDGACSLQSPCCSDNPWFHRQLPQPTTDAIEMRVCRDESRNNNEDIEIQTIEIYIQ